MRELIVGNKKKVKLLLHDDIDQMPISQFNKVNKYWMLSDNLGNDFADIDKTHLSKLILIAGDKDKTIKEIHNLRILINNILTDVHPDQLAFACLIHSIDDKEITDYSEDNLKRIIASLPLTVGDIKKKTPGRKSTLI